MAATVEGPAHAPALVLANSLGTTQRVWEEVLPLLVEHFRVIRFDHRGHGASHAPDGPWTVADLGHDVLALLDELGVVRASYAGLSIGGMIGIWLAAHAPERVDGLVLICTSANLHAEEAWRGRATMVRAHGMTAIVDAVVERWFTPEFARRNPAVVDEFKGILASTPAAGYAACCEALATMDLTHELTLINAPTLVIAAADDLAIPPVHGKEISTGVEGARLHVVRHAAHIATVEQPEQIGHAMLHHLCAQEG